MPRADHVLAAQSTHVASVERVQACRCRPGPHEEMDEHAWHEVSVVPDADHVPAAQSTHFASSSGKQACWCIPEGQELMVVHSQASYVPMRPRSWQQLKHESEFDGQQLKVVPTAAAASSIASAARSRDAGAMTMTVGRGECD